MTDTTESLRAVTPGALRQEAEYELFPKGGYWRMRLLELADAWAADKKRLEVAERRIAYLEEAACICEYGPMLGDGRMDSNKCPVHDVQ